MFISIPGLHPPDANSTPHPSYDNQKCVKTLTDVLCRTKLPVVQNHCLTGPLGLIPACLYLPEHPILSQTSFLSTGSVCPLVWLISCLFQPPQYSTVLWELMQPLANPPIVRISSWNIPCSNPNLRTLFPTALSMAWWVFLSDPTYSSLPIQTIFPPNIPQAIQPLRKGVGKLQPTGQIWPTTCFYTAWQLRMVFTFWNGWGEKF